MDSLSQLGAGFADFLTDPIMFLLAAVGVLLGTVAGLLPGIGPSTSIALLLPVAMILDPAPALVLMISIYIGCEYGGRISAILLNIPGDAGAIMTMLDGYPLAKKGQAALALSISAISSFVGSIISVFGLVLLAQPLSALGLQFGPSAFFAVVVMALILSSTLVGKSLLRGAIALLLGLAIATIGIDSQAGIPRFTFGLSEFLNGIDPIIPIVGIFGIGEILWIIGHPSGSGADKAIKAKGAWPRWREVWSVKWSTLRASVIGFIAGVLPGSGTTLAAFLSYSTERSLSKKPEEFGKGSLDGLAAPEAANNSAVGGAMVPLLTLGIPGSGTTAVLLAYLVMYGLDPGPSFFTNHGDIAWVVIASMFVSSLMALLVNVPMIPAFAKVLEVPMRFLFPVVLVLAIISGVAVSNSLFDAMLVLLFGVIGYAMRAARLSGALVVIGLVLGQILELSFRQAYLLSNGDVFDMLTEPLALVFYGIAIVVVIGDVFRRRNAKKQDLLATATPDALPTDDTSPDETELAETKRADERP